MIHARSLFAAGCALALIGCAPETKQPAQVMALVRAAGSGDSPGGTYQPTQVALTTVHDVVSLDGDAAHLVGGAKIVVDPNDPLLKLNNGALSDDQIADIFVKSEGNAPRASYVEKDGVLWPADFHTWNLVTSYYNLEQAFLYFQELGVPAETLQGLRVYYFPSFTLSALGQNELKDNAMFFAPVRSMLILPFDQLQEAPLAMNSWVVSHEYAHVVWNRLVYGGAAFPAPLVQWSGLASTPQVNTLKALDEGLADFHAVAQSCETDFGCDPRGPESSFDQRLADRRDMSRPVCMNTSLQNALDEMSVNDFSAAGDDYAVGTVIASALYHAGKSPEDWKLLSKSVVAAYPEIKSLIDASLQSPPDFTLAKVVDLLLGEISSPDLKTRACGELMGRLKLNPDTPLQNCPPQAVPTKDCP